jgi:hypothetical protein
MEKESGVNMETREKHRGYLTGINSQKDHIKQSPTWIVLFTGDRTKLFRLYNSDSFHHQLPGIQCLPFSSMFTWLSSACIKTPSRSF